MAVEEIRQIKDKHPQFTRADRFKILENYFGIPEETAREADRYLRAIREVFPKDAVGAELEKEWHNTPATREVQTWESIFKRNGLNA